MIEVDIADAVPLALRHRQHYRVQLMLWGKEQVTGEHRDDAGSVRQRILKAL